MLIGRHRGGPVWLNNFAGASFFTAYQPPAPTVGAVQVSNWADFKNALDTGATTVEIMVSTITMTDNYQPAFAGTATVVSMVVGGTEFVGLYRIYWYNKIGYFRGITFSNVGTGYQIKGFSRDLTFYQCVFTPAIACANAVQHNHTFMFGCVVDGDFSGYPVDLSVNGDAANCLFINRRAGSGEIGLQASTGASVYNCGAFCPNDTGTSNCFSGTNITGDYNIGDSTAATSAAVWAAQSHNVLGPLATYFNGTTWVPTHTTSKAGGDPTHEAALDLFSNDLSVLSQVPIGAIYAGT